MSKHSDSDNVFMDFLKGFLTMPSEKPSLTLSFLRGAIFSVVLSLIFGFETMTELLLTAGVVGVFWVIIDAIIWKRQAKRKGD